MIDLRKIKNILLLALLLGFVVLMTERCTYDKLKPTLTRVILIKDFDFVPKLVTVNAGDTILFKWESGVHPTASDDGAWTTFTLNSTDTTKTIVLNSVKEYPYHCTAHGLTGGVGMSGIIIVK